MRTAGIDVSHKTVTLCLNKGGKLGKAREFANAAEGYRALLKVLKGANIERLLDEFLR